MFKPIRHALVLSFAGLGALLLFSPAASGGKRVRACKVQRDCDDGLYCNGRERCDWKDRKNKRLGKICKRGKTVRCNDGISCTKDRCDEHERSCVYEPPDRDGDSFGDAKCKDRDGVPLGSDCNDRDPNRYPGNTEVCDSRGHDEDCDPNTYGKKDSDGDGFVDQGCYNWKVPNGDVRRRRKIRGNDCDDKRRDVHPNQVEVCNGRDDNCRGGVDEGVKTRVYRDADHDLFGNPKKSKLMCLDKMAGEWVQNPHDCNDKDPKKNPVAGCP